MPHLSLAAVRALWTDELSRSSLSASVATPSSSGALIVAVVAAAGSGACSLCSLSFQHC
jgi:hypothetical protein